MPTATHRSTAAQELDEFRARVADEIQHYRDNGDLCEEEAAGLVQRLGLEDIPDVTPQKIHFHVGLCISSTTNNGPLSEQSHEVISEVADATGEWLAAQLNERGLRRSNTVTVGGETATVTFTGVEYVETEYEECDDPEGDH